VGRQGSIGGEAREQDGKQGSRRGGKGAAGEAIKGAAGEAREQEGKLHIRYTHKKQWVSKKSIGGVESQQNSFCFCSVQ
jgi:hypothetical protein